jgi:hypothetical protein
MDDIPAPQARRVKCLSGGSLHSHTVEVPLVLVLQFLTHTLIKIDGDLDRFVAQNGVWFHDRALDDRKW